MPRPWRVLGSEVVHRDRWISVRADDCRTADDLPVTPYYVLEYPDWCHVVGFTDDGRVLLIRQYRHGAGTICWEIPGGCVEEGEDPAAAVARELREETGYVAATIEPLIASSPNPASHTNTLHSYVGFGLRPDGPAAPEGAEEIEVGLFTRDEVLGLIADGEFNQAMQIGSVLLAFHRIP